MSALTRERVDRLVARARAYRDGDGRRWPDALVGLLFFEESLRTRVGFDVAAARLGARSSSVLAPKQAATMWAPESLEDTVRSVAGWFDVLCLRHADEDSLARVAQAVGVPVVNCGNGTAEHPTQALVDVFALAELIGSVDGLTVAIVGDLHAMRTAHSFALALGCFDDVMMRCIRPDGLDLPERYVPEGVQMQTTAMMDVEDVDVLYVAGLPAETCIGVLAAARQADFQVTAEVVARMPAAARVLCPLPRVDEILPEVDALEQAAYFRASELALWMRMAVLDEALASG